jgi:hypothetical protein
MTRESMEGTFNAYIDDLVHVENDSDAARMYDSGDGGAGPMYDTGDFGGPVYDDRITSGAEHVVMYTCDSGNGEDVPSGQHGKGPAHSVIPMFRSAPAPRVHMTPVSVYKASPKSTSAYDRLADCQDSLADIDESVFNDPFSPSQDSKGYLQVD